MSADAFLLNFLNRFGHLGDLSVTRLKAQRTHQQLKYSLIMRWFSPYYLYYLPSSYQISVPARPGWIDLGSVSLCCDGNTNLQVRNLDEIRFCLVLADHREGRFDFFARNLNVAAEHHFPRTEKIHDGKLVKNKMHIVYETNDYNRLYTHGQWVIVPTWNSWIECIKPNKYQNSEQYNDKHKVKSGATTHLTNKQNCYIIFIITLIKNICKNSEIRYTSRKALGICHRN